MRTAQPEHRLWLPHYGLIEVRLRACPPPRALTALWLIGFELEPQQSGELCVVELFGRDIRADGSARRGLGIHPFGDPSLREDFAQLETASDVRDWHTYSVEWMLGAARFYCDDLLVAEADQSPDYPLQLMLNLYELPGDEPRELAEFPLEAAVQWVREWQRR